jgi:hypothetical protein
MLCPVTLRIPEDKCTPPKTLLVEINDEAGRLICWCGPYDAPGARECVKLFTPPFGEGLVNTP